LSPETHLHRDLGTQDLPGIAEAKPFVRYFDLPPITDLLVENPKLVPNTVSNRI
jgi:hypothetical protein